MPRVPNYEQTGGQVAPSEAQLRAPDRASGAMELAAGLNHAAGALADYGQVRDQITAMSEETQARQQALADSQAVAKVLASYSTQQGQNAVDAQAGVLKQIDAIRAAGAKAMGTPRMQRFYSQHADPIFANAGGEVYGHAIQQTKVAFGQQLQAETGAAMDAAAGLYQQPDKFGAALDTVRAKAAAEARFAGMGEEAAGEYVKGKAGEAVLGAMHSALAAQNVDIAKAIDNAFGGEKLPFALRNQAVDMMAKPLLTRQYAAIFQAGQVGQNAPTQTEDGNWIVPRATGPAPGSGAPMPGGKVAYQMPVAGAHVTDTFAQHEARGSAGVDLAVPVNTPIKAPAVGTVIKVGQDDRSGNFVMIRHPDGFVSSYAHMGNVAVKDGDQVNANTVLGTVGLTGHTTGAHVHVRMRDPQGNDVDPMKVLGGRPGTYAAVTAPGAPAQLDEARVIANIRGMGLSPEMEAGAIEYARGQIGQAKAVQEQAYADAEDRVHEWVDNFALTHGNHYPPPEAIPSSLIGVMKPGRAAQFKLEIARSREAEMKADGRDGQSRAYNDLQVMKYEHPEQFMALNPGDLVGKLSAGQWGEFRVQQAAMRAQAAHPKPWDPYKGANAALETFTRLHPDPSARSVFSPDWAKSNPAAAAQQRAAMLESIRLQAEGDAAKRGNRAPTNQEWLDYAKTAASTIAVTGTFGGTRQVHGYDLTISQIPEATKQMIRDAFKRANGYDAPDSEVVRAYWANMSAARRRQGQ